MLFRRFYDDNLAQASYMIACEKTREAIVVDPSSDVAQYTRAAGDEKRSSSTPTLTWRNTLARREPIVCESLT